MKRSALLAMLMLLFAAPVGAAPQLPSPLPDPCDQLIALLTTTSSPDDRRKVAEALADLNRHGQCLADAMMQRASFPSFVKALEALRTDKQSGASTGAGGSTNLVSKGTTAKILSIAAEYGALTETVNKQIVTVQGSADGIPAALIRHNLIRYCPTHGTDDCASSTLIETLQRFSYAISFDTSSSAQSVSGTATGAALGTAQPVAFTADGHSITAVALRAVLWNARDKVSKSFQDAWKKKAKEPSSALDAAARKLLQSAAGFLDLVTGDPAYPTWQTDTVTELVTATKEDSHRSWDARLQLLAELLHVRHPDLREKAAETATAFRAYRFEEDAVVSALQKPIATLQYDYKRTANQPVTSTFRLVFDKGLPDGWSFTANGAVEVYHERPAAAIPGDGSVRDAQVGVQFQKDLGTVNLLGAAAIAGTYYFQYQNRPSILNVRPGTPVAGIGLIDLPSTATEVFATKGHIQVAQVRLVLGPEKSSARFPIAVSYSTRTELIDRPLWRGQVGVSYDFDSLFGK